MYLTPKIDAIKSLRVAKGLSQHRLSRNAGLAGNAINRIERKESEHIHYLRAREIAKALDCQVEDIFVKPKGA